MARCPNDVSHISFEELDHCEGPLDLVESFMLDNANVMADSQNRLTQSQDVTAWIRSPELIDTAILNNLDDLSHLLNSRCLSEITSSRTLLDVGCYGGYVFDYLRAHPLSKQWRLKYHGMDNRSTAISLARQLHNQYDNASFSIGDIYDIKQTIKEKYNVVLCSRVLIHLPRFREAVSSLLDASKDCLLIVGRITAVGRCKIRRKINKLEPSQMLCFYRTLSIDDIDQVAKENHVVPYYRNVRPDAYCSILLVKNPSLKKELSRGPWKWLDSEKASQKVNIEDQKHISARKLSIMRALPFLKCLGGKPNRS